MLSDEEKRKLIEQYSFGRDINAFALVAEVERAVLAKESSKMLFNGSHGHAGYVIDDNVEAMQQSYGDPLPFIPWSKERDFFDSMQANEGAPPQAAAIPAGWIDDWEKNVLLMWVCVRKHDSRIPDDVLDFMREFLLSAAPKPEGK